MTLTFDVPIQIVHTNRKKTVSFQVIGNSVKVSAPRHLTDKELENLILRRMSWIKKKLHSPKAPPKPKNYTNGEVFTYLGTDYRLNLVSGEAESIRLNNQCLEVTVPESVSDMEAPLFIKQSITRWYIQTAFEVLTEKTQYFARLTGVVPNSIKIKEHKARWGSCSYKNDISYNWRLIIAPQPVVDYVVVHELCHILEHNHSPRFWQHVGNIMPSFKEHRAWLKQNEGKLIF